MENLVEKSLKRCLKRKFKITLGLVTAFLIMGISALSDDAVLNITQEADGEVLFNGKVFDEKNHEFIGNTFEDNIYTNYNSIDSVTFEDNIENISFINESYLTGTGKYSYAIRNSSKNLIMFENNGQIKNTYGGIYNDEGNINEVINNGTFIVSEDKGAYGIYNYCGEIKSIKNTGLLHSAKRGISNTNGHINKIENTGLFYSSIYSEYLSPEFYPNRPDNFGNSVIKEINNKGEFFQFADAGPCVILELKSSGNLNYEDEKIMNNGKMVGIAKGTISSSVIYVGESYKKFENLENAGLLYSYDESKNIRQYATIENIMNVINKGAIIKIRNNDYDKVKGTAIKIGDTDNLTSYGIISANKPYVIEDYSGKIVNLGLLMDENGHILIPNYSDKNWEISKKVKEEIIETGAEKEVDIADGKTEKIKNESGKIIINAGSDKDGYVQSISSDAIKNLSEDKGYILNGYDKTVLINSDTGKKNINSSIINAVKNAVSFDGKDLTLGLKNTIVNGGYGEDIISGDDNGNTLNLSGETIINGNVNLGAGSDVLSLDDAVQINGILNGGEDSDIDILTFNSSKISETLSNSEASTENNNINILYDIKNFDEANINTDVTLFEKTVDENGNIKTLEAQLGDITIGENGNLNLRIDGTEKDEESGKVIGHALYGNNGSITSNGGKLNLKTFGFGEEEVVDFKDTDLSGLKEENITISSALHEGKIIEAGEKNLVEVSAKKDLEDLDISNYDKLNKIYHSILNSQNVDKFTVEEEQYKDFVNYISDIYVASPYAYSSELSRKSMNMFKDTALSKDLKPELNNWAVFGGFTHVDGGTKESYYGKGYYTYDIGSKDVEADTKITGAYIQAEYGKSETLSTGILFGGNNAETELNTGKAEGDLFYFGAHAKKFINDFRFTLGAGFQHGDYKADRTALGYNGITETRKYSENYHDRGFNIYGDVKYSKEIIKDLFIEPYFNLEYSYIDQDGADERGVLAMETDSKNFDYTTGKVGVDVKKIIPMEKTKHIFTAGISYENILSGADEEYITGRFKNGTDFDILVPEKNDDVFSINAKYELEFESGIMFELKGIYSFEHDDMEDEWTAGIGIGYRF